MEIQIDMYQTLAVSVLVLVLGQFLKKRINFLEKFCIPAPVIGGLLFAVLTCVCYSLGIAEFTFDDTLREVCKGATTICTAAATFGLIAGSLIGGPIGKRLIDRKKLLDTAVAEDDSILVEDEKKHERHTNMYAAAVFQLIIAVGIGTIISELLTKTGLTFPIYIGAMIAAAVIRNIGEYSGKFDIYMGEINNLGGICLSLFLGMAMITLKLWQLAELALPLIILLSAQLILMMLFTYFVVFNVMGRDYDAAVLSAGTCGFGMGATPNAMANMQAICDRYVPSVKAYLIIPLIGSLFADFLNSLVITFFINIL